MHLPTRSAALCQRQPALTILPMTPLASSRPVLALAHATLAQECKAAQAASAHLAKLVPQRRHASAALTTLLPPPLMLP